LMLGTSDPRKEAMVFAVARVSGNLPENAGGENAAFLGLLAGRRKLSATVRG